VGVLDWFRKRWELALFFLGAGMCFSFILPQRPHFWIVTAAVTGLSTLKRWRVARAILWVVMAFWVYEAVAFGLVLWWATPWWVRVATPLLLVAAALRRIPLALALGPWILFCLLGWRAEEGTLRCDDLRRITAQPGVSIALPTLDRCDGEQFIIGRYPRRVWEAPGRLVVTTQFYKDFRHPGISRPSSLTGSICEVKPEGTRCFGEGTAQEIVEAGDRLYIAAYQQHHPDGRGILYAVDKADPMKVLASRRFRGDTGEFYVDPKADVGGVVFDQVTDLIPVRASDLTPGPPIPVRLDPGDTRYDMSRGEGIFCFAAGPLFPDQGTAFASVAFQGAPFRHRLLAPGGSSWVSLSWGCDWDPAGRRAFVASANLGWLGVIDYDGGQYLRRWFVGLGVRAVTWDPARRRVYLGDFLRGEVFAVDPDTGRETGRWFAGRFVRQIVLSKDSLLVTSNAGVVRIAL
jgi:hypothetical protein